MAALTACNLRENTLLPPNLDPKEYVESNDILVYSDHLIKCENDDSYLYIPKESIKEGALIYGDRVVLRRVESLLERDSLAFVTDAETYTDTYQVDVIRSSVHVLLDSIPAFATLYTDLESVRHPQHTVLMQSSWVLNDQPVNLYPYGNKRCFFDIDGNGELALMDPGHSDVLQLEASGKDTQALISRPGEELFIWLPAAYMSSPVTLSVADSLSPTDLDLTQTVFPGFALNSPVLNVKTAYSGDAVPIVRFRSGVKGSFAAQWTRINDGVLKGWPSAQDTWLYEGTELVSFLQGRGRYFLLTPIADQTQINIPLDGSYGQLYLQDLWLDLRGISSPGLSLGIDLEPQTQSVIDAYFSGSPFQIGQAWQAFSISLRQGNSQIMDLPDDQWFELGLRAKHDNWSASRLSRIYRDSSQDIISYKSYGSSYDDTHFTQSNGFIYAGIASSGTYLLAPVTEPGTLRVPCLKPQVQIQTQRLSLSWNDPSLPCNAVSFSFGTMLSATHPWLNGYPYTMSNRQAIMKIDALGRKSPVDTLPANLFLSYPMSYSPQAVINFNVSETWPKWYRYKAVSAFEHNGFLMNGNSLQISPATPGYIFDASRLSHSGSSYNLKPYARMTWDERDYEAYLESSLAMPDGGILQITPKTAFTDRLNILSSQYQLSALAPVYDLRVNGNSSFYQSFQPLIRIRQTTRRANHLFSVSDAQYYRVYTYNQASVLDGWHFTLEDGHVSFYLAYDAEYGAATDLNPHTSVEVVASSSANPLIASLYQAQVDVPASLIGSYMPIGTRLILSEATDPPPNAIGSKRVVLRNAQGVIITPNFYTVPLEVPVPYIYVPIANYTPGMNLRMFYRDLSGTVTEFTRVQSFSPDPVDEFLVVGNCAVCFINNSGLFYVTP